MDQLEPDAVDPECAKPGILSVPDFYLGVGRGASERMRAESPPRQNPALMEKTRLCRDLRPGEGRLNNIDEISHVGGVIRKKNALRPYRGF